jgi:hypothetical protein
MARNAKLAKGVRRGALAAATTAVKIKKRPRGKPFPKGHSIGAEFRWKKGDPSPNPSGRPACKEISKALREILASEKLFQPRTGAERLAIKWFLQSLGGNITALISLADRVEGKAATSISIQERENDPLDQLILLMNSQVAGLKPEGFIEYKPNLPQLPAETTEATDVES